MPARSNPFQTLIYQIHKHFERDSDFSVTESKALINSATGEHREVDIVIEGEIASIPVIVSFECCAYGRRASSPWVESMIGKHQNLPTGQLILVSESGFSRPAHALVAKTKNAEAITLKEAAATDWSVYVRRKLDFVSFNYTPTGMLLVFEDQPTGARPMILTPSTRIRFLKDGKEFIGFHFCRWLLSRSTAPHAAARQWYDEALRSEVVYFDFKMEWEPDVRTLAAVNDHEMRVIQKVSVEALGAIKRRPLSWNYRLFRETPLAFANIDGPTVHPHSKLGNRAILAVTEHEDGTPRASLSFPDAHPDTEKIIDLVYHPSNVKSQRGC